MKATWRFGSLLGVGAMVAAGVLGATSAYAAEEDDSSAGSIDESIVWVDIEWAGSVEVPFVDDTTEVYETSTVTLCTGWFVSAEGHVATAGHCVEPNLDIVLSLYYNVIQENDLDIGDMSLGDLDWDYQLDDPVVYIGQPSGVEGILAGESRLSQVIDYQSFLEGDNALLKIARGIDNAPALVVAAETPEVGDDVTSIGYAGSVDDVTDTQSQPPSHKRGSVSSLSTTTKGVPMIEIDAAVTQGMSGGPTLNADGEVIGINSFNIRDESQPFNFVTDTEELRNFLEQNSIDMPVGTSNDSKGGDEAVVAEGSAAEVEPASSSSSGGDSSGLLITLIILLVALLVIAAAVVVLLLRRRKPVEAGAAANAPPATVVQSAPAAVSPSMAAPAPMATPVQPPVQVLEPEAPPQQPAQPAYGGEFPPAPAVPPPTPSDPSQQG